MTGESETANLIMQQPLNDAAKVLRCGLPEGAAVPTSQCVLALNHSRPAQTQQDTTQRRYLNEFELDNPQEW